MTEKHASGIKIEIIRSRRKTMALQVTADARVLVRVPYQVSEEVIQRFVKERSDWIQKNLEMMQERKKEQSGLSPISMEEVRALGAQALSVLPKKTAFYAAKMGVTYGKITIRNQTSRWGSCSSKGNLNFNCLLMLAPEEVQDYVVVHELCHRKEMNHSERFWMEVEQVLPDYRKQKQWLKEHGGALIARMKA